MKKKFMATYMKIFLLILFLLTITFYSSGCILLVNSNYKLSDYADEIDFNNLDFYYNDFDFNYSTVEHNYSINDNIKDIEISLESQNLNIIEYDGNDIKVEIKSNRNSNYELSKSEVGNKLTFSSNHSTPKNSTVNISIPNKLINQVSLKLTTSSGNISSSNLNLKSLTIFTASGGANLSNINSEYISINSVSGDIDLNNMSVSSETKISSTSGDISSNGNLGVLYVSSTSGDIDITFKDSLKNSSLGTVSGSISLSIPQECGYKINYSTISGDIDTSKLSNGNEESLIEIKTTSGDIYIN